MSIAEVATHFRVSETTVSRGLGVFGRLRRVQLTARRVVFVRTDVERLDRDMERAAVALVSNSETRD
jgi:DNA-binding transcriptional regulator YhcF (GntR family)